MLTAVDSSILFSIFKGEADATDWVDRLVGERGRGQLVVCDVVYAEIATLFPDHSEMESTLARLGIRLDPIGAAAAHMAGQVFLEYRRRGGPRKYMVPDFLIGAHAAAQATALIAKDRGYLRRFFGTLELRGIE